MVEVTSHQNAFKWNTMSKKIHLLNSNIISRLIKKHKQLIKTTNILYDGSVFFITDLHIINS